MTRKRGVYFFRRRLPRSHAGEVALSLQTRAYRAAEALAEAINSAFENFFVRLCMAAFDVADALRRYLLEERAKLRALHIDTPPGKRIYGSNISGNDSHSRDLEHTAMSIASLQDSLARRRIFIKDQEADRIIDEHPATDEERKELALGLMQADIQNLEQSRAWLTGGLVDAIEPVTVVAAKSTPPLQSLEPVAAPIVAGPTLSEVLPAFLDYMTNDKGWRGQTLAQNTTTYRKLKEVCGDNPLSSLCDAT